MFTILQLTEKIDVAYIWKEKILYYALLPLGSLSARSNI